MQATTLLRHKAGHAPIAFEWDNTSNLPVKSGGYGRWRAFVLAQHPAAEAGDSPERLFGRLAMRHVLDARHQQHLDRAGAFLLRDLDLPHCAVMVLVALDDQHRHADIG